MNRYHLVFVLYALLSAGGIMPLMAQHMKWLNPEKDDRVVIQGQLWQDTSHIGSYQRLPLAAKGLVRDKVWDLSKNAAGLYIRFRSDARIVQVRYALKDRLSLNHMPATGVSGVDLYALDASDQWQWARGIYKTLRNDTVLVSFDTLESHLVKEYRLYLPLYNTINWLEIGVDASAGFEPVKNAPGRIVVYGTSIAQGASASRAGMAWTAILNRRLNTPVVNLGFSANGTLDPEIVRLFADKEAQLFILDCLPNLTVFGEDEVRTKLIEAARLIRAQHKHTPIIFTEHADATIWLLNADKQQSFIRINQVMKDVFETLKTHIDNIYLLTAEEIGLDINSTTDGVHPSDLGMMKYADAYERLIRRILREKRKDALGALQTY